MIWQIITSFLASATFGILFNVPKKALFKCGFTGMVGWMLYFILVDRGMNVVISSLIGAWGAGVISHFFARRYKTPVIIFSVCGVIPLVPGGSAYDAMRHFVVNDNGAMPLAAKVLFISGAIAVGLAISEVQNQLIREKLRKRWHKG